MLTQNILTQPTFDLIDWSIINYKSTDKILFCQSNRVFKFDKCKGTVMPSDLVLKANTCYNQSRLVKNIIGTVIQAGFCGNLNFKIELTDDAVKEIFKMRIPFEENLNKRDKKGFDMKEILNENSFTASRVFKTIIQIDLNPFPNNYYSGTNQTELEPDVFFCGEVSKTKNFVEWFDSQTPKKLKEILEKCTHTKSSLSDIYQEEIKK